MRLIYEPAALKDLIKMPKVDAQLIRAALAQVVEAHPDRMPFVTELVGQPDTWRLRKGIWRAVYHLAGDAMYVTQVQKRGEVYR